LDIFHFLESPCNPEGVVLHRINSIQYPTVHFYLKILLKQQGT